MRNRKHDLFLVACHSDRRDLVARTCEGGAPEQEHLFCRPPPVASFEALAMLEEPLGVIFALPY